MIDTLNDIVNVNFVTALVVITMSVGSGVIFREVTNSNLLTVLLVPALAFGALVSIYAMSMAGVFFTSNHESNTVVTSSVGMILALLIVLGLIRLRLAYGDMKKPPDPAGRLRESDPGT
jgi:hypothetical protein